MRTVELAEATGTLSDYAKKARKAPLVLMRRGKPVAALLPLDADAWEDFVTGTHPKFLEIIERSRASYRARGGIPLKTIEREPWAETLDRAEEQSQACGQGHIVASSGTSWPHEDAGALRHFYGASDVAVFLAHEL